MRRGQAAGEAVVAALLLALTVAALVAAAGEAWQRASWRVEGRAPMRGQALVELLALLPVLAACVCAFAIGAARIAAIAEAERELARAVRADAAGLVPAPAPGVALERDGGRLAVRVRAPLGDVVRATEGFG